MTRTSPLITIGNPIALNFQGSDGLLPDWLLLAPAAQFAGRDGRTFDNSQPATVLQSIIDRGVDLPVDVEHATELKAVNGDPAPARGWIRANAASLAVRNGEIWGRVEWNQAGADMVRGEEYRYYSPVYYLHRNTVRIAGIKSVGMTNTPNLSLTALNTEDRTDMNIPAELLAALGLPATATLAEALAALKALQTEKETDTAMNRHLPDMAAYVPKATFDLALNRAAAAEAALAAKETAERDTAINTAIDAALHAGKIAPANKDFYMAACRQEGGLAAFNTFLTTAPVITALSGLDGKSPTAQTVALNAEERYVAEQMGMSHADYLKAKEAN